MMKGNTTGTLLTTEEVSSILKLHPKTIYRWIAEGKIPSSKINGQLRFNCTDIQKWLDTNSCRQVSKEDSLNLLDFQIPKSIKLDLKGASAMSKNSRCWNLGYGSVYLQKTKKGGLRFKVSFYDCHRKRIQCVAKGATTLDEAIVFLKREVQKEFAKRHGVELKAERISFRDLASIFLEDYMKSERKNWKSDHYRLQKLICYFGDCELNQLSPQTIRKFKRQRAELGNSQSTINRYLALLKKMFNYAIDEDYLKENPVKKVKFASELDRVRNHVYSYEDEERLLRESSEQLRSVIVTAVNSGMRIGEILNLNWANVDFDRKVIKVERTKSKKARFIPVNATLFEELRKIKQADFCDVRVFPFKSIRTAFENARRRAGLTEYNFQDFRRTFGTRLLERGVDIVTIQKLLGHSSPAVTYRYLHPDDSIKRGAVELLDRGESDPLFHICSTENEKVVNIH